MLDTGASHLLMNLDHLTEEQASEAKRIHVNQATGAPKRALLLNGVIYAADVGRVLVSVGALKERLRLHFEWTGVDPMLILEDAQGRWELFRGGVDGRLPVLTQGQFKVLFRAYQDSFLGVAWDRQRWVDELGGKDLTKAVAHITVTLGATQVKNFEDAADRVLRHSIPAATSLNPAVANVEMKPDEVQSIPGDDLTDLTFDDEAVDSLEENPKGDIQGSDGTPIPLTQSQVELLLEHVRSGHLKRTGVAHIDICGPLPLSWEGHRYILVLGLRLLDDAPLLISARGLATRTSVEVTTALGEMVDELEDYDLIELPLSNGKRIVKVQSDRACEFESRNFAEFCRARGLTSSVTKDYDPAANGTAERVIRLIKTGLRKLLAATAFPKASWGYLLRHLVQSYFLAAIGREQVSIPLGTLVIARTLAPRPSPEQRGVVGRLLFHDHLHDGSSYLLMDDDVVRCGYPVACPEDRDLLDTACELDAVNLLTGIMTSKVGVPSRKLADDLGEASAKVRDRTSPRDEVDDLEVAESHGKGMALQPENAPRRVDDEQLELEDVLGVASTKVRDRTSPDDHAADPRVAEPSSKEPADEPPVDKSLLFDAGEIRRTFRNNDPGKACQAIGMKSLNVGPRAVSSSECSDLLRSNILV